MFMGLKIGIPALMMGASALALSLTLTGPTLDPRITFTRASTATYYNSSGVLTSAAINAPRFDYSPYDLSARGLLIEEARTNLLQRSAELDNAYWSVDNTTVTANQGLAPDGTTTAELIDEGTVNARHILYQNGSLTLTAANYTLSCYVKDVDRRYVVLGCDSTTSFRVYFDLTTGTVTDQVAGATGTIQPVGNGIYRLTCTFLATAVASYPQIGLGNFSTAAASSLAFGMPSYLGTNKKIYAWGMQLELGAFATSYIPTTSASATRAADVAAMAGTDFSSWFNATEGTFVVEATTYNAAAVVSGSFSNTLICVRDSGTNEIFFIERTLTSGNGTFDLRDGGVVQAALSTAAWPAGGTSKIAAVYKANDFAAVRDGGTVQTDTGGTLPTVTQMQIGSLSTGGYWNGWIKSIKYYRTRLANAQLVTLTTADPTLGQLAFNNPYMGGLWALLEDI